KRSSEAGAIGAALASVGISYLLKAFLPQIPFLDRMGIVFVAALVIAILLSYAMPASAGSDRIRTDNVSFDTQRGFNVASIAIVAILIALYATWW
ncbi:MAG: sodium transporter, partial [Blastomonas sp.]|nr:sodium transporter [Blastomonas sp.]